MSLPVFTRFLAQTSVDNSRLDFQKDKITYALSRESKKVQLAQVLLEINSLQNIHLTLNQGLALLEKAPHNTGISGKDSELKRANSLTKWNIILKELTSLCKLPIWRLKILFRI